MFMNSQLKKDSLISFEQRLTPLDLETILTELYTNSLESLKNKQSGINRIVLSVFILFQHVQHSVNTSIWASSFWWYTVREDVIC